MAIVDAGANGIWAIGSNWPWPKIYFGRNYTLAFVKGLASGYLWVYELYCTTGDAWTATAVKSLGALTNIDKVEVADFGEFYAVSRFGITNNVAYMDGFLREPSGRIVDLPTDSVPVFGTCCNFNGQAIIGCIAHGDDDHWGDLGYNSVVWSSIGKFNFRLTPLDSGSGTKDGKFWLQPDVGWRNMPWGEWRTGIVHKVAKLGKGVMVYGDGGSALLFPVNEPAVTFGLKDSIGPAVRSGNHIAGDENGHVVIDDFDEVWRIGSDGPEKLGYKDYIRGLTAGNIHVSHVPGRQRFFISDGVTGFCLTPSGMYEVHQLVSSAGTYRGILCGFFKDSEDYEARVETDILDYNQRGMKTISCLEVGGDFYDGSETPIKVSIKYRYDHKTASFSQTGWVSVNPEGQAVLPVTAPEFKLLVKVDDYRGNTVNLDYIKARIKMSDRRFIRGTYDASHALARTDK